MNVSTRTQAVLEVSKLESIVFDVLLSRGSNAGTDTSINGYVTMTLNGALNLSRGCLAVDESSDGDSAAGPRISG